MRGRFFPLAVTWLLTVFVLLASGCEDEIERVDGPEFSQQTAESVAAMAAPVGEVAEALCECAVEREEFDSTDACLEAHGLAGLEEDLEQTESCVYDRLSEPSQPPPVPMAEVFECYDEVAAEMQTCADEFLQPSEEHEQADEEPEAQEDEQQDEDEEAEDNGEGQAEDEEGDDENEDDGDEADEEEKDECELLMERFERWNECIDGVERIHGAACEERVSSVLGDWDEYEGDTVDPFAGCGTGFLEVSEDEVDEQPDEQPDDEEEQEDDEEEGDDE